MAAPDYDVIKEIPGYKVILKAVLKSQIQQLVEQLATSTDEESVILTASVADGTLSHLGSESGKGFLEDHEDIKSQFLGFCLKKHHRKKQEEKERREAEALQQSMQTSPGRFGGHPGPYAARSPRFASPRAQSPLHPIALTRASPGGHIRSPGIRHEPYPMNRPPRMKRTSLNFEQGKGQATGPSQTLRSPSANKLDGQVIKIEPEDDNEASNHSESDTVNQDKPASSSQSPSHQSNAPSSVKSESGEKEDDDAKSESSSSTIPNEPPSEGLGLDSDLSNLISGSNQPHTSESSEIDPNVSVKLEALTENEMELEITGVEPGRPPVPQDNWDPNVSMGMNFDPTGATGSQGDMTAQGYRLPHRPVAPVESPRDVLNRAVNVVSNAVSTSRAGRQGRRGPSRTSVRLRFYLLPDRSKVPKLKGNNRDDELVRLHHSCNYGFPGGIDQAVSFPIGSTTDNMQQGLLDLYPHQPAGTLFTLHHLVNKRLAIIEGPIAELYGFRGVVWLKTKQQRAAGEQNQPSAVHPTQSQPPPTTTVSHSIPEHEQRGSSTNYTA